MRLERYWTPPLHRTIRYSRAAEYTQHFATLFEKAVTERMPAADVALDLSGGMDSSSIAAVAATYASAQGRQVTAYTNTCDRLIPEDKEGVYARMIAAWLNIPVHFIASENYPLFDRFDDPRLRSAEPIANPGIAEYYDKAQRIIDSGCRVMLSGQMGDTLFAGSISYLPHLLRTGRLYRFLQEAYVHRKHTGTLRGLGLRAMAEAAVRRPARRQPWQPDMPSWINPEFAERVRLGERWPAIWQMWNDLNDMHGQLRRPWFSQFFESYDQVRLPMVTRHPFSDIRLVEFMLGAPGFVHSNKWVLREAMRERLPPIIVSRPKEGLPGDLRLAKMMAGLRRPLPLLEATEPYVDTAEFSQTYRQFPQNGAEGSTWSSWLINAPIALAYWMNNNLQHAHQTYEQAN
jgi:asparagine synthase (glutamine-hydrolysing)